MLELPHPHVQYLAGHGLLTTAARERAPGAMPAREGA
jgi:hypothetical protein